MTKDLLNILDFPHNNNKRKIPFILLHFLCILKALNIFLKLSCLKIF